LDRDRGDNGGQIIACLPLRHGGKEMLLCDASFAWH
jgi:hypothetical protein